MDDLCVNMTMGRGAGKRFDATNRHVAMPSEQDTADAPQKRGGPGLFHREAGHYFGSGMVSAGFPAKKLCGIRVKPNQWVGITGQSSIAVM
jgi:hypothetical protein